MQQLVTNHSYFLRLVHLERFALLTMNFLLEQDWSCREVAGKLLEKPTH